MTQVLPATSLDVNAQTVPHESMDARKLEATNRCSLESAERFIRQGMDDHNGGVNHAYRSSQPSTRKGHYGRKITTTDRQVEKLLEGDPQTEKQIEQ